MKSAKERKMNMAEQGKSGQSKTLEMRVAELEDKLSKIHITEDEMKAYQKVSGLLGQSAQPALSPTVCVINRCISTGCITSTCISTNCITTLCIRQSCIFECTCGPCGGCITQAKDPTGGFGNLGS
jgi:uncharacterized protein YgbK (DUF1537 family)